MLSIRYGIEDTFYTFHTFRGKFTPKFHYFPDRRIAQMGAKLINFPHLPDLPNKFITRVTDFYSFSTQNTRPLGHQCQLALCRHRQLPSNA